MKNTRTAPRREVRYDRLEQVLEDVDRLVAAGASTTGNWSIPQIIDHLARMIDKSIDGFDFRAAWPVRFLGRHVFKKRFLHKPMPAGFKLPARARASLTSNRQDPAEAQAHIHGAIGRFLAATNCQPHPVLGALTHDEWTLLHCRHCELHMSFIANP